MIPETRTVLGISGEHFTIDEQISYTPEAGFPAADPRLQGRLLMLKTANCIFDDARYPEWGSDDNPYFGHVSWDYPDGQWDPERHTDEFIAQLPTYRRYGLTLVNVNLMGNQPTGLAGGHPWINSAYTPKGDLKPAYMNRLMRVLDAADQAGLVVMIGLFYPQQDHHVMVQDTVVKDDALIRKCIVNVMHFLVQSRHRNVLVEIGNESNHPLYEHWMLRGDRVLEAMQIAREAGEGLFPVSTSCFHVADLPDRAFELMDYIPLHTPFGLPELLAEQIQAARACVGNSKPIINKEDTSVFCLAASLEHGAGFGLFHQGLNNYREGFQSVPVNWRINTLAKWNYFSQVARLTGSPLPIHPDDLPDAPTLRLKGLEPEQTVRNIESLTIEVEAPEYYAAGYPLYLQRVEYFIDGHPVKYAHATRKTNYSEKFSKAGSFDVQAFRLHGKDMLNGPLGFDLRKLPNGEHTLMAIPYYVDEWILTGVHIGGFRDRTGQLVEIPFRTAF